MFSWRSLKENAELTERFPILENGRLIQNLSGIHRLGKLMVNEGFLAVSISFCCSSNICSFICLLVGFNNVLQNLRLRKKIVSVVGFKTVEFNLPFQISPT